MNPERVILLIVAGSIVMMLNIIYFDLREQRESDAIGAYIEANDCVIATMRPELFGSKPDIYRCNKPEPRRINRDEIRQLVKEGLVTK